MQECMQVLSMAEQVGNFTNLARQWASGDNRSADVLSKSLFFISAGSNDLFEYIDLGPQYNDTDLLQSLVASYAAYLRVSSNYSIQSVFYYTCQTCSL